LFRAKIGRPNGIVRVIHNGVSKSEFAPVAVAPKATDLIFIGEFRPVKGIDILIDAIARLHAAGRAVTATLVGSGPEEPALKAQVQRMSLQHAVRFLPAMAAREALALGRIMVIPSRAESLPYVVLETAAAAKPLITTDVGGVPEIFGPLSPALVEVGNPAALAAAIEHAIENPAAAARLAEELRDRVASSFSVDAMVDGVVSAYHDALVQALPAPKAALAPK
jgi:glycosyltransferase involved in cell wall biosynthesis